MSLELKYFVLKPCTSNADIYALRDAILRTDSTDIDNVAVRLQPVLNKARYSAAFARASRVAIRVFAREIKDDDFELATELDEWMNELESGPRLDGTHCESTAEDSQ